MGSQSDYLFGALIMGFLIFITARNELPVYIGFLLKSGPKSNTANAASVGIAGAANVQAIPADSSGKFSTSDAIHAATTVAEIIAL